jgi:tRNA-specific 2-thiouridylase
VRQEAHRLALPNRDRPDSQGICFLGRVPYDAFVEYHLGSRIGEIRDARSGKALGEHRGHWFYTIGQRRGLGLARGPWYVVDKDPDRNVVSVVHGDALADHSRRKLTVPHPNWIVGPPVKRRLTARIRHGERLIGCRVRLLEDGSAEVTLNTDDPGIAAGQFAVLYDGDECLGGGSIGPAQRPPVPAS